MNAKKPKRIRYEKRGFRYVKKTKQEHKDSENMKLRLDQKTI